MLIFTCIAFWDLISLKVLTRHYDILHKQHLPEDSSSSNNLTYIYLFQHSMSPWSDNNCLYDQHLHNYNKSKLLLAQFQFVFDITKSTPSEWFSLYEGRAFWWIWWHIWFLTMLTRTSWMIIWRLWAFMLIFDQCHLTWQLIQWYFRMRMLDGFKFLNDLDCLIPWKIIRLWQ